MPLDNSENWFKYLRHVEIRLIGDVGRYCREVDIHPANLQEIQKIIRRALDRSTDDGDAWLREKFRRDWFYGEHRSLDEMVHRQRDLSESVEDLKRMTTTRLAKIEVLLSDGSNGCRFEPSDAGMPRTDSFMTIEPSESGEKAKASPKLFMERLKKVAQDARVLVLVEPYAFANTNDSGDKGDCLDKIEEIITSAAIERLHLYCRQDVSSLNVIKKLENNKNLERKISIYVGDLHDRYLLSGSDEKGENLSWHNCSNWKGSTFGASLNGISKRPTYVVPFERGDIVEVKRYLEDHTVPKSLEILKQELQKNLDNRNAAKAARAQNDNKCSP